MAKHPHLLALINKKTWKCMLDGCSFFVHTGLQHVLVGKSAVCWHCEDKFPLNEMSLKDDKPICDECRTGVSQEVLDMYMKEKMPDDK